jgi:hypothetical protein
MTGGHTDPGDPTSAHRPPIEHPIPHTGHLVQILEPEA